MRNYSLFTYSYRQSIQLSTRSKNVLITAYYIWYLSWISSVHFMDDAPEALRSVPADPLSAYGNTTCGC